MLVPIFVFSPLLCQGGKFHPIFSAWVKMVFNIAGMMVGLHYFLLFNTVGLNLYMHCVDKADKLLYYNATCNM